MNPSGLSDCPLNSRSNVMDKVVVDQTEGNLLTYEISDEAIEAAGCPANSLAYAATVAFCSGLDTCPA